MWREFREFAVRGNMVDLMVGLVVGAGFGSLVNSFVDNIFMPPLGLVLGPVRFADRFIDLSGEHHATLADAQAAGAPTINYGLFVNQVVEFVIIAFAVFLVVRQVNRLRDEKPPEAPNSRPCPFCARDIPIQASRCPECTSQLSAS